MRLTVARRAWECWLAAAGPWRGWAVCPALVAPGLAEVVPRHIQAHAAGPLADELAIALRHEGTLSGGEGTAQGQLGTVPGGVGTARGQVGTPPGGVGAARSQVGMPPGGVGTAVVLDLDPGLGASVAARLSELGLAHVALVLPRWPYRQAVLPVDGLLQLLVNEARRLSSAAEGLPNVVFVLDAERNRPLLNRSKSDKRADNRYTLAAADLPNLAALRARGIGRILKLTKP